MQPTRGEAEHLAEVMSHTALRYRLLWFDGNPVASFQAASHACEEGCPMFVDAPPGWLRVTTSFALPEAPSLALRRRLAQVQVDGGFGNATIDRGRVRLSIALPGLQTFGSPVIGGIQRLHELRT